MHTQLYKNLKNVYKYIIYNIYTKKTKMQSTNESASDKKTSNKNTHHLRYTDF